MNLKVMLSGAMIALAALSAPAFADDAYGLSVSSGNGAVHQKLASRVAAVPKGSFHIDTAYPASLKCTAPDGISLEKSDLSSADGTIEKKKASFELLAIPAKPGKYLIPCELRFGVATDTEMKPESTKVEFAVEAK